MTQVLIRNLNPRTIVLLKEHARKHGYSLQTELKNIIERVAKEYSFDYGKSAARIRLQITKKQKTNSTDLIAEDRRR